MLPAWLSERDLPWLRDLLFEARAFAGRPVADLRQRWRRSDPDPRAGNRLAAARHVLLGLLTVRRRVPDYAAIRARLFAAVAAGQSRAAALAGVAAATGRAADRLLPELFADLPHERPLSWPSPSPSPMTIALAHNRAAAMGLLATAENATLHLSGEARAVLRTAWLLGTWFTVTESRPERTHLHWCPPAGDRRAARRLAALVPLLPWARWFELRAHCRLHGNGGTFVLSTLDAILPGPPPRPFDSELERRFALDFAAATAAWELVREPAPLPRVGTLAFPDFLLRHRASGAVFWLEVAGLRDRGALPGKLLLLAAEPGYVLCLDRRHLPEAWREHPRVVPFTRHLVAGDVLEVVENLRQRGESRPR